MNKPKFIHLHVHSDYSMIDGIAKVNELVNRSYSLNMPSLALTDFSNLFGLIKFYNFSYKIGIKPIIGVDFLISSPCLNHTFELTFLAINNIGYHNLKLLITKGYQRGYSNVGPIIDLNWLTYQNEGLIVLSGGYKGDLGKYLLNDDKILIDKSLLFYEKYFPNRFYLEITRTGRDNEEKYLNLAVELAKIKGLPVVATNDVRFIYRKDFYAHEIRVAICKGYTIDDKNRLHIYSKEQFMKSEQEMCELFSDLPESLVNTVEIACRCNVVIKFGSCFLPKFSTGNKSMEDFFVDCAFQGLEKRLSFLFPDIEEKKLKRSVYDIRLKNELNIINQMGFPGYFLIVMEFIQWAKVNNIPVGPGRGSGTGSLVAYSLGITDIDPLSFGLLFERFLNPERVSMPDLDIDFCMEKRDKVIEHVVERYGEDSVSQIITFATMAARVVIRDVGRVLNYPYSFIDKIAKLIPLEIGITLDKSLSSEVKLRELYENDDEVKILIDVARELEGVIRNIGKHAGGVVISPTKMTDFSPLYYDINGNFPMTHFDKDDIEKIGLVKFDFLGLRTLTIIDWTLQMINHNRTNNDLLPIKISSISLQDKKSFDLLRKAETRAIFQLESKGMKDLIKRLQPDSFEDIIALLALFRPGPLQSGMVDNFINRKHGREKLAYPDIQWQHKLLQPVLESTYGIILYQEQIMKIAQVFAGYTLGNADLLRRAISKKNMEEMAKQRLIFKQGANNLGIDNKLSMKIFNLVEKFAGYGFNKSHSVGYALISYYTLWLKTHYPAEFMSSVLNADIDNTDKVVELISECYRMGLQISPPDINNSQYYFYVDHEKKIIYGIGAIKGIGKGCVKEIISARNKHGNFNKFFDICLYTDIKKINRRVLKRLILSGSCDVFKIHRSILINSIDNCINFANKYVNIKNSGQKDLFKTLDNQLFISMCFNYEINDQHMLPQYLIAEGEKKTLGFYLTEHPILQYLEEIKHYDKDILKLKDVSLIYCEKIISVFGLIISSKIIRTKSGRCLCICVLDDHSGKIDIIFFSNLLRKYQNFLQKNYFVFVKGLLKIDVLHNSFKIIAYELIEINEARKQYISNIVIFLTEKHIDDYFLNRLHLFLKPYLGGNIPIHILYHKKNMCVRLRLSSAWYVFPTDQLLHDLRSLIGTKQIKLEFHQ